MSLETLHLSHSYGQHRVLQDINLKIHRGQFVALVGPSGCHRKGQSILMYDGSVKKVEDIVVGDQLMGMDSTPRTVLSLIRGHGRMVMINPIKGESFAVNEDHILSLIRRSHGKKNKTDNKKGEIIDVSVKEWFKWSRTRKSLYKLFRTGVDFDNCDKKLLLVDPYFLGTLIGDGGLTDTTPDITTLDFEIIHEIVRQSKKWGLRVSSYLKDNTKAVTFRLVGKKGKKNPLTNSLKKLGLWGKGSANKFIPQVYLTSSYGNRLELLAGLIDTDGDYKRCFYFTSTSEKLVEDVVFLSKSLGFAAYKSGPFTKKNQNGVECICWRTTISGNLDLIPTKIARKKAAPRKQIKSVLVAGFSAKRLKKEEDYFGFNVDGDNRYLMGDFTVTHNCGKSTLLRAILGTHPPTNGAAYIDGKQIDGPTRSVGIVYQHYSLYDFLTARENVAFGPKLDQTSLPFRFFCFWEWNKLHKRMLEEADELLTEFGLEEAINQYPTGLSGGMRQRVAIAQALIMKPKVLLLDEPFGALDEITRHELQMTLLKLYQQNVAATEKGQEPPYTVIFVTHELNEAFYVADRVIGLSQYHGRGYAGASIVYDQPAPVFSPTCTRDYTLFHDQKEKMREVVFNERDKPIKDEFIHKWE